MAKNYLIPIKHMYDAALEAKEIAKGKSLDDIQNERMLNLSLVKLIEIIGEAASRITQETQNKYSDIPWEKIIGMRNQLIHGYDIINFEILYQTINEDLPPLIASLEKIITQEEK